MSYRDFAQGLSSKQVARRKELQQQAENRRQLSEEEEFVSILRPISAREAAERDLFKPQSSGSFR